MKKGVFTVVNYFAPKRGLLSMHCSATADRQSSRSSLLFGLSGTGKTTLSADPKRDLIGDDEHVWSDDGVFNVEGGCYAKAINLSPENEPDILQALRFGAVLENVVLEEDHEVDFSDTSITENTRGAYPINFIKNARIPCMAGHPTDVIFLTCDAFGVLPPVSVLSPEQAMYHFISGYTAKVAGTEEGVKEPSATFSPCFGGPFLVWHPSKYAELLAKKMCEHQAQVWLVNTGWSGGGYGVGKRIKLAHTRAIIDGIHSGQLANSPRERHFEHRQHRFRAGAEARGDRPQKNWLFAGHDAAAANQARLWSLIASAERHAIDPQRYLTSVLAKLPLIASQAGSPSADELTQFLPDGGLAKTRPSHWPQKLDHSSGTRTLPHLCSAEWTPEASANNDAV